MLIGAGAAPRYFDIAEGERRLMLGVLAKKADATGRHASARNETRIVARWFLRT